MKKISKFLLLIIIMTFSFTISNVYAEEKITIESITIDEKSDTATELSKPTKDGMNIGFDLSFAQVNDYVKYKVIINNPTNEEYQIEKEAKFNSSDYLTYKYEFDNNSNIIKKNSKLTMYITITYKTEISNDKLIDGKFIENNNVSINLVNDKNITKNPITGNSIFILVFILMIVTIISFVLFKNTRNKKYLNIMIFSLLLIPIGIYALEKLQINVRTKITIEKTPQEKNCTFSGDMVQGAEYTNGIYTYRYKQDGNGDTTTIYDFLGWANIDIDGWGVVFTPVITGDELTAEEKNITEAPCTNINGKPVVSYDTMFSEANVESIDTTGWNTSQVRSMVGMFHWVKATSLNLLGLDTSNVESMKSMFYAYRGNNIDLSSFDTSNVTNMENMFLNTSLTTLDLSSFNTSNVTNMRYMFSDSSSLETIYVSDLWDTSNVTNGNGMFSYCTSLPNYDYNFSGLEKANYNGGYLTYKPHP